MRNGYCFPLRSWWYVHMPVSTGCLLKWYQKHGTRKRTILTVDSFVTTAQAFLFTLLNYQSSVAIAIEMQFFSRFASQFPFCFLHRSVRFLFKFTLPRYQRLTKKPLYCRTQRNNKTFRVEQRQIQLERNKGKKWTNTLDIYKSKYAKKLLLHKKNLRKTAVFKI